MRDLRDFQPQHLYGVTQRGNQGKWVYRDDDDFRKALELMRRYARRYEVRIHGYCLMHNHGHWIFEASTEDSISNLMRDMQGNYSRYLNQKYKDRPWVLFVPFGRKADPGMMAYFRAGPVNAL
ncbi:MAG: transposase [Bryobacteraceae bacterium]|nr:transposase [Bryobacteraceae bacterium]